MHAALLELQKELHSIERTEQV